MPPTTKNPLAGRLARNTGSMLLGQGGRVLLKIVYFVLLARGLGVADFGAFVAVVALAALLAPFASAGSGNLLVRAVARDPTAEPVYWANALRLTALSAFLLTGLLLAVSPLVAPPSVSMVAVACIAVADLYFGRLTEVAGHLFQARERLGWTAAFQLALNLLRLLGALVLFLGPWTPDVDTWAVVYLLTSVPAALAAVWMGTRAVGPATSDLRVFRREWRDGALFAFSLSAQSAYNDIDKVMLARLGSVEAAGIYAAAYRIVDVAFRPMMALLAAAYPQFFRHGAGGVRPALVFLKRLALPGVSYAAAASLALFLLAGMVPVLLGESYAASVGALQGLAALPLLRALHFLAADLLTGCGHQGLRTAVQVVVAFLNVGLNIVLIPMYSWGGAVAASLICDGLMVVLLWTIVRRKVRQQPEAPHRTVQPQ
jgi:O-antigen/teichoic acid export membrane protein